MPKFRVIDLRSELSQPEQIVEASTPEAAAMRVLQEAIVRGGGKRNKLLCRVYWQSGEGTNMVRFYRPVGARS